MSRPAPTLATVAADLAAVLKRKRPAWCSAETHAAGKAFLASLRVDARAQVDAAETRELAAEALGVERVALWRWLTKGWLA